MLKSDTTSETTERQTEPKPEDRGLSEQSPKLPKVVSFSSLASCGDEIWIENNGTLYRLRRTSQGKLILTK